MEQLQLDALDIKRTKVTAGLQHLFLRFSGQTEDDMSDNLDADGAKRRDSLFETGADNRGWINADDSRRVRGPAPFRQA